MMGKKLLAVVLLLFFTCGAASAEPLAPTDAFYVCDAANVLSDETEAHIVRCNDALFAICGAQIVFVTLDTTAPAALPDYAYELFNAWGIGSAARNNGLLLIMAVGDDDYWLTVGAGYEAFLTVDVVGSLLDEYLEPYFAAQDYDGGARSLFDALLVRVAAYEWLASLRPLLNAVGCAASR